MPKRVLITGATGLLGSHLALKLIEEGYTVNATCREESNTGFTEKIFGYYRENARELAAAINWIKCNLYDRGSVIEAVKGCDTVFHCAAIVSFNAGDKESLVRNNVTVTRNVAEACLLSGNIRLIHVSSTAAIGAGGDNITVSESSPWDENSKHSPYAESKHLSEEAVWQSVRDGLNAVIVNPSVIIGPGDWTRSSAQFFSAVDRGMLFYTNGVTGYVDVADVVNLMCILAEGTIRGERFLVTSENLSVKEMLSTVAKSIGKRAPFIFVPGILAKPLVRIISFFSSLFTGNPLTVKDAIGSAYSKTFFDNTKVIKATGYSFGTVSEAIMKTGKKYRKDYPK